MGNPRIISFIARSKRRLDILKLLNKSGKSQVELMRETGMYKTHTSRTLKELSEKNLVVCKNPEDRAFRFYKITKKGNEILEEAKKLTER